MSSTATPVPVTTSIAPTVIPSPQPTTNGTLAGNGDNNGSSAWVGAIIAVVAALAICAVVLHCATAKIRERRLASRRAERALMSARSNALEEMLAEFEREEYTDPRAASKQSVKGSLPQSRPLLYGGAGNVTSPRDGDAHVQAPAATEIMDAYASDEFAGGIDEDDLAAIPIVDAEEVAWEQQVPGATHITQVISTLPAAGVNVHDDEANDELLHAFSPVVILNGTQQSPLGSAPPRVRADGGTVGPPFMQSIPSATMVRRIQLNGESDVATNEE